MRESFVIHTEYIEDLPEENKAEFLIYIYNYGAKGTEPELTGFAKTVWLKIKRRIDADIEQYESTINARSAAGKKHKGNQYTKEVEQNGTNGTQSQSVEQNGTNGTVNVFVSDNEFENEDVNTHTENKEAAENVCVPAYIPEPNKKIDKNLANDLHNALFSHNETTTKDRKVPISKDLFTFSCKEMRELLSAIGPREDGNRVRQALQNFLKVCKSDTWQKSHTWSTFCKHYADYTPEFFTLERYLNAEPETEDATQKPEYKFYLTMRTDARFHVETFERHIKDWKEAGRPEGEEYIQLQKKWEVEECL